MKHLIRIIAITVLAALLSTSTAEAQRHNGTDKKRKPSTADNATDIGATRRHAPGATAAPQRGTGIIIPPPGQHLT